MKALIEIPQIDLRALKPICETNKISRSEAVRRAIRFYIKKNQMSGASDKTDRAFGLWKTHPVDSLAYQQKIRAEWER